MSSHKPDYHDAMFVWERHRRIISLQPRGKKPVERWDDEPKTLAFIRQHWGFEQETRFNIGIVCGSELVVIDADELSRARELFRRLPRTDMMTRTARGVHFFYQAPDEQITPRVKATVLGIEVDIRAGMSYVLGPGSIHPSGFRYERIGNWNLVDVPRFNSSWIEQSPIHSSTGSRKRVSNGVAYIGHIRAISGQGGHNAAFRSACVLRDSGVSEAEALAALIDWNTTNAEPPFSIPELLHKVKDAYAKGAISCSP